MRNLESAYVCVWTIWLVSLGVCPKARADGHAFLDGVRLPLIANGGPTYLGINEFRPERFLLGLNEKSLPTGLLLSVGFERAFIAAGILPNVSGLLILDFNRAVIEHAQLNARLLGLPSQTPRSYLRLRNSAAATELQRLVRPGDDPGPALISSFVKNSAVLWGEFFGPNGRLSSGANYWVSETTASKLIEMGRRRRIVARQVDLLDSFGRLGLVVDGLHRARERVSVVDLSNIGEWLFDEFGLAGGAKALGMVLSTLAPVLEPQAVLLFTHIDQFGSGDFFDYQSELITRVLEFDEFELSARFAPAWHHSSPRRGRSWSYLPRSACATFLDQ